MLKKLNNIDSVISSDLKNKLKICLIERMKDIKEEIQVEAITSLKYLQEVKNRFCPVINAFLFILKHNGLSLRSRLKILDVLAINRESFTIIKKLISNQTDLEIRLKAYDILIEQIPVKFYDEQYRICLLKEIFIEESDCNLE